jgi:hypothetical protein
VGPLEAVTLLPSGGAVGALGLPDDYLCGDHRGPYREAGLWGLIRVYAPVAGGIALRPLVAR